MSTPPQPPQAIATALDALRHVYTPSPYVERRFKAAEDWKDSVGYSLRNRSFGRRTEQTLGSVIRAAYAIVLGEPGAGKSTVSRAAVIECLKRWNEGVVPFRIELRRYRGSLTDLLQQDEHAPSNALEAALTASLGSTSRAYILDGLDEVPVELIPGLAEEIEALVGGGMTASAYLTCRQAFYAYHRNLFKHPPIAFTLLDLMARDIRFLISKTELNPDEVLAEVNRVQLHDEIANPFVLNVILGEYREHRRLSARRSASLRTVVSRTLDTVHGADLGRHRRALRMIAVAMETYARNELTLDEARRVLTSSMPIEPTSAMELLHELMRSILVQTASGISFQMRSFGEYLAAEELEISDFDKILDLVCVPDTRVPQESWQNALTYLVEMHRRVRAYFTRHHPEWVVNASPDAFSARERAALVRDLLARLAAGDEYLFGHELVRLQRLIQFVTPEVRGELRTRYESTDADGMNALVLLAALGDPVVRDRAVSLATDQRQRQLHRLSGMQACAMQGDVETLRTLQAALTDTDPLYLSMLDSIGSLMDAATLPEIVPLLLRADAFISGAFYRAQELDGRKDVEAVLAFLLSTPTIARHSRAGSYVEPILEHLREYWDAAIAAHVADVFVAWERAGLWDQNNRVAEVLVKTVQEMDATGATSRAILEQLMERGDRLQHIARSLAWMTSPEVGVWCAVQSRGHEYVRELAFHALWDLRDALHPFVPGIPSPQELCERQDADEAREDEERRLRSRQATRMAQTDSFGVFLGISLRLKPLYWPSLDASRQAWLSDQVSHELAGSGLPSSVRWLDANSYNLPSRLSPTIHVMNHYGLAVDGDRYVVQSLLGVEPKEIAAYYERAGFSPGARVEFETLLRSVSTSQPGPLSNFFGFLYRTSFWSEAVASTLSDVALDRSATEHHRLSAIELLGRHHAAVERLATLRNDPSPAVARKSVEALLTMQHRPTIGRCLKELLASDAALQASEGTAGFSVDSPAAWLQLIKTKDVWNRLVDVRAAALRLALPNLVSVVTATMKAIDFKSLIGVIKSQLDVAPASWRDSLRMRLAEYQREVHLASAQGAPFDDVLRRLRFATSMKLFKLWCEGAHDIGVWEAWCRKWPGMEAVAVVVDAIGGWNEVRSNSFRFGRLWDGCHDLIVVMDGDRGRDLAVSGRPLSSAAQDLETRLREREIDLRVLQRYGPENYFSQPACEGVLGASLGQYFPLPHDRAVDQLLPNFTKMSNVRVAEQMTSSDLAGTDVAELLDEIRDRATLLA